MPLPVQVCRISIYKIHYLHFSIHDYVPQLIEISQYLKTARAHIHTHIRMQLRMYRRIFTYNRLPMAKKQYHKTKISSAAQLLAIVCNILISNPSKDRNWYFCLRQRECYFKSSPHVLSLCNSIDFIENINNVLLQKVVMKYIYIWTR